MKKLEYTSPELQITLLLESDLLWESGDEVNTDEDMDWIGGFRLK